MSKQRAFALLVAAAFLTALFWAKARDPFRRINFSLRTKAGKTEGIAVLPKKKAAYAVVIYLHGSGGSMLHSGDELRQIAELNLAAVDFEYNQTNQAAFDEEFAALQHYLSRRSWAKSSTQSTFAGSSRGNEAPSSKADSGQSLLTSAATNARKIAVAWIGSSLGAQRILSFVLRHPEYQPQLLVRLSGGWVKELGEKPTNESSLAEPAASTLNSQPSTNLRCSVLLVHGGNDEIFPVADSHALAKLLREKGTPVELHVFPNESHDFGADRPLIIRGLAEYCAGFFDANFANSRESLHPLQRNIRPTYWYYWLPVGLLGLCLVVVGYVNHRGSLSALSDPFPKLSRVLFYFAWLVVLIAVAVTAFHLGWPHLRVSEGRLTLTRRWLVKPALRTDFDWLANKPIWRGQPISALLQHLNLASYNRGLVNWQYDDKTYRHFVLSPIIGGKVDERLDWRRPLWESFYPRIRHET
ncbi:MAG TPA: prolyl oligopeptidase family serine peptidase, partial [Verrucomicrobiae bacterium]|nr:prolyl oligopeptidase family serine peptidase [Verrucomicrobiae bacterium]